MLTGSPGPGLTPEPGWGIPEAMIRTAGLLSLLTVTILRKMYKMNPRVAVSLMPGWPMRL